MIQIIVQIVSVIIIVKILEEVNYILRFISLINLKTVTSLKPKITSIFIILILTMT